VLELEHWHEFFVLIGTAGATLVALLFVAISLGAGFLTDKRAAATRAFFSPVVVHFTAVFFISAVGLFPAHKVSMFAVLIGGCAVIGAAVSIFTTVELLRHNWTRYAQDHLAYGLLPLISYAALLVAAVMIWTEREYSLLVLAGALLTLLMVNIRNAWDLTLSMVREQASGRPDP
jgi:hypothetical protein